MITKHKISGIALGAALAFGAATSAAQATTIYATSADHTVVGTGITDPARLIEANALGAPDQVLGGPVKFLSLGLGGEAIFEFGRLFTGPIKAIEVTYGKRDDHVETADVYAGLAGVFQYVGSIVNTTGFDSLDFAGSFTHLKLVDTSPVVDGRDGFDIDAIGVTPAPIPLPAGGLLLLSALGAGAALRRRAKKTA